MENLVSSQYFENLRNFISLGRFKFKNFNEISYENQKAEDEERYPENSDDWNILEGLKTRFRN